MNFSAVGVDGVEVRLDSSEEHGGTGTGLRPMELMLVSLGSCTGMDVLSILRKKRQQVTEYRIEVRGEQADQYPHVFTHIRLRHLVTGIGLREDALQRAIELSERKYCPAYAMLSQVTPITTEYEIAQVPAD
jgi:putative redox protein